MLTKYGSSARTSPSVPSVVPCTASVLCERNPPSRNFLGTLREHPDASKMSEHSNGSPKPSIPPQQIDPTTGEVLLPFEFNVIQYSSLLKGCSWTMDTLAVFGPARIELTMPRPSTRCAVPESLRARGIDQEEYDAMLLDVKTALAQTMPYFSPLCALNFGMTLVLIPCMIISLCSLPTDIRKISERSADLVDEAIKERALNWKARYGVEVRLDRNITWQRPYVPAEDAMFGWTGNVSSTPWEHGNRLVFTPPASQGMNKA